MKQVLIVEDQRMPRENMERVISESDNYTLSASVNGADVALAICRRQAYRSYIDGCMYVRK